MPHKYLTLKMCRVCTTVWGRANKHLSVAKIPLIIKSVLLLPVYQPYIVQKQQSRLPIWHLSECHHHLSWDLKEKKKWRKGVYLMLMHWWILQKVSKMKRRAFSMKSSRQATRKKSFTKTCKDDEYFLIKPSKKRNILQTSQLWVQVMWNVDKEQAATGGHTWSSTYSKRYTSRNPDVISQRGKTTVRHYKTSLRKDHTAKI